MTTTKQAAGTLARFALANYEAQKEIARKGGVAPLIELLDRTESEVTQEHAAAALAELALVPNNKSVIDRAGGIAPLVALLLNDSAMTAKKHAASALARMATEGKGTSDAELQAAAKRVDMQGKSKKRKDDAPSKAEQIAAAGAITP